MDVKLIPSASRHAQTIHRTMSKPRCTKKILEQGVGPTGSNSRRITRPWLFIHLNMDKILIVGCADCHNIIQIHNIVSWTDIIPWNIPHIRLV